MTANSFLTEVCNFKIAIINGDYFCLTESDTLMLDQNLEGSTSIKLT